MKNISIVEICTVWVKCKILNVLSRIINYWFHGINYHICTQCRQPAPNYFTNLKALKRPFYTVECESCELAVASTAVRNYGKVTRQVLHCWSQQEGWVGRVYSTPRDHKNILMNSYFCVSIYMYIYMRIIFVLREKKCKRRTDYATAVCFLNFVPTRSKI
jgi:hypothetical protein